jgi:hypothetical protein
MTKKLDLMGYVFERLTVIRESKRVNGKVFWECRCVCGEIVIVRGSSLTSKNTQSCGCLSDDALISRSRTHGRSKSRAYYSWSSMHTRCNNPKHRNFNTYGGKGIRADPQWNDFAIFYADMGDPPVGMSLDRIDSNGHYSKDNCRWATHVQQANNRINNHIVTWEGKSQTVSQWSKELGIRSATLHRRLRKGWDIDRALTAPLGYTSKYKKDKE